MPNPLVTQVTFQQLVDQIKVESRIKGADNLDITIMSILNELLLVHSETERYAELLIRNVPIAGVVGQQEYPLPVDYANIRSLYYARTGDTSRGRILRQRNDFIEESRDGYEPKYYEIVAGNVVVFPFLGILTTDTFSLDYWQYPTSLVAPTDLFPIPRLVPVVKRETIARMLIYNKDLQSAQLFDKSASEESGRQMTSEENADTQ